MPPKVLFFISIFLIILGLSLRYLKLKRNNFVGYRTPKALTNDATWQYANSLYSKILIICNIITFSIAAGEMLYGESHHTFYILNFSVFLAGIVFSMYVTEKRLKQKFPNT